MQITAENHDFAHRVIVTVLAFAKDRDNPVNPSMSMVGHSASYTASAFGVFEDLVHATIRMGGAHVSPPSQRALLRLKDQVQHPSLMQIRCCDDKKKLPPSLGGGTSGHHVAG